MSAYDDAKAQLAAAQTAAKATADQATALTAQAAKLNDSAKQTLALVGAVVIPPEPVVVPPAPDDPWANIDKTGATVVNAAVQAILSAGDAKMAAGKYLIDPAKPLLVTHNLDMTDAILIAKPNALPRYYVMKATAADITVKGGIIKGDRLKHTYTAGSTHEWGYGFSIEGARCVVDGLNVSECTGDGIRATARDCIIRNTVATKNRRQGMSVFGATGLKVYDSEFSFTGALLTDPAATNGPCAGVDIEPDVGVSLVVRFERCKFPNNRSGLLAWLRAEVGGSITFDAIDCDFEGNANGVYAKALAGSIGGSVSGSRVTKNTGSGIRIESASTIAINDNVFTGIGSRNAFDLVGTDVRTRYDINVPTGSGGKANVGLNHYK